MKTTMTISKTFSDIPFGHRQPNHDGHCKWFHGHNWDIQIEIELTPGGETDANGFILDYGKMGFLKEWIEENLDHAMVISKDDQQAIACVGDYPKLFKVHRVEDGSCEGMAQYLFDLFNQMILEETDHNAQLASLTLFEDRKNTATVYREREGDDS